MFILYELLIIISYLLNDYIGALVTVLVSIFLFKKNKGSKINWFVDMMILTLPLHSISIVGNKLHHAISWPIICILIVTIYNLKIIIKEKIKIKKQYTLLLIIVSFILIVSNCRINYIKGIIELLQIMLMAIPIITTYINREHLSKLVKNFNYNEIIVKILQVIMAVAIGVIFQFIMHKFFDIQLGRITIFVKRVVYDLFFNAYSVLSLFLSLGVVILAEMVLNDILNKNIKIKTIIINILQILVIFIAIVINSSRTGIIAALISLVLLFISKMKKLSKKQIVIIVLAALVCFVAFIMLMTVVRKDMASFFSDNQRFKTYKDALKIILYTPANFILGCGLDSANYKQVMPHNFIIETLLTTGIIVTGAIMYWLIKLLTKLTKTSYRFLIYDIIAGCMFITCFHGNPFTTIIFIFAIIDQTNKEGEMLNERQRIDNSSGTDI